MSEPMDPENGKRSGRLYLGVKPTWERWALVLLVLFFVWFGWNVLQRSAFSDRRRTDAGVFFRAGWAVRNDVSPYRVTDENDFYYLYPPGMAAMFVPLADPPAAPPLPFEKDPKTHARPPGYLPYPVSVVLWYVLCVGCVGVSVHCVCKALEESSSDPAVRSITPRWGGWWNLRFWPLLAVLPDIGSSLSKGQVNTILLACLAGGMLMLVRGRKVAAGVLLALAACIKVFPGIFGFEVLARRDRKMILGYALCGAACMIVLPVVVFGPAKAMEYTLVFADRVLLSGLLGKETTLQSGSGWSNTDNQAIAGVLHNVMNITTPRMQRPATPAWWVQPVHAAVSLGLIGTTIVLGRGWKFWAWAQEGGLASILRLSMLSCVMIAAVPMCHRHYAVFLYPAVAALVFLSMQRSTLGLPTGAGLAVAAGLPIALGIPKFQQTGLLRDLPMLLVCTLVVWGLCAAALWREARAENAGPVAR